MHTGRPALSPRSTPPPPPILRPQNPHPACSSTLRTPLHGYPSRHAFHICGRRASARTPSHGAGSGRAALAGVFTEVSSGGMRECCRAATIPRPCRNDRPIARMPRKICALHGTAAQRCHAARQTVQFTDRCQTITTGPTWSCSSWSYVPPLQWRGHLSKAAGQPNGAMCCFSGGA